MILTVGNKIIYPGRGLCLIGPVVKKDVEGRPVSAMTIRYLDWCSTKLAAVAVEKTHFAEKFMMRQAEQSAYAGIL